MDWLAFAGSILGGLIGGLFTFIGVSLTIKHEDKQKKLEELKMANENKPRLEIIRAVDFDLEAKNMSKLHADINALVLKINSFKEEHGRAMFEYDYSLDEKELHCFEFIMKNTGLTEIEDICLTSNLPKDTGLMNYYSSEMYLSNKLLSYDVWSDKRYLKPGSSLKVRIIFPKDKIIVSNLGSAIISIWLKDVNGMVWHQPLFVEKKETEISRLSSIKEFKNATDIETSIKCFKNPYKW